ncbi:DUF2381 family protein [Myxococcus sp. RHSTA-1-4]|uniref:DUF2381 family protein n=1 Tax=Myxococcus sp. RHSTA-1-4 TaxID=2874601 RepID=UPI001CC18F17|nr:DUF2381 family protein [Myxococcus sp. RHSTA-1-4]
MLTWGLLLASGAWAADSEVSALTSGVRRIELRAAPSSSLPEVRIGPGLSTTVFFDSRIAPEYVVLEGRERFQRVGIADDHLALIPSGTFRHGERLRLEVRFHDDAAPERAAVMLVVDASHVERQVEVYRQPRSAESYRQEVEELRAGGLRLQREVDRLRLTRAPTGGIEALVASMRGSDVFQLRRVSYQRVESPAPLSVFFTDVVTLAETWAGLRVSLEMWEPGPDWTAAGASLVDARGHIVKVLRPWQQEPLRFKEDRIIVIPGEQAKTLPRGRYTLKLWDEGGGRPVTIEGIEVP